jgi:hypothetical protein
MCCLLHLGFSLQVHKLKTKLVHTVQSDCSWTSGLMIGPVFNILYAAFNSFQSEVIFFVSPYILFVFDTLFCYMMTHSVFVVVLLTFQRFRDSGNWVVWATNLQAQVPQVPAATSLFPLLSSTFPSLPRSPIACAAVSPAALSPALILPRRCSAQQPGASSEASSAAAGRSAARQRRSSQAHPRACTYRGRRRQPREEAEQPASFDHPKVSPNSSSPSFSWPPSR